MQGQVDAATGAATAAVGSSSLADISLPHLTNEAQALISSGGGLGAIVVKHIMQVTQDALVVTQSVACHYEHSCVLQCQHFS